MTADAAVVARQLGRPPRALRRVAHRCPCGLPDVVETAPRLAGGTPFPTLYYLTCPRAVAAMSRLEAAGVMRTMQRRLANDPGLRAAYRAAHLDYLARRDEAAAAAGVEPLPPGTQSAGGMPDRVKCLHALAAHELAAPGTNPLGREAVAAAGRWWAAGPCIPPGRPQEPGNSEAVAAPEGCPADPGVAPGNIRPETRPARRDGPSATGRDGPSATGGGPRLATGGDGPSAIGRDGTSATGGGLPSSVRGAEA